MKSAFATTEPYFGKQGEIYDGTNGNRYPLSLLDYIFSSEDINLPYCKFYDQSGERYSNKIIEK